MGNVGYIVALGVVLVGAFLWKWCRRGRTRTIGGERYAWISQTADDGFASDDDNAVSFSDTATDDLEVGGLNDSHAWNLDADVQLQQLDAPEASRAHAKEASPASGAGFAVTAMLSNGLMASMLPPVADTKSSPPPNGSGPSHPQLELSHLDISVDPDRPAAGDATDEDDADSAVGGGFDFGSEDGASLFEQPVDELEMQMDNAADRLMEPSEYLMQTSIPREFENLANDLPLMNDYDRMRTLAQKKKRVRKKPVGWFDWF